MLIVLVWWDFIKILYIINILYDIIKKKNNNSIILKRLCDISCVFYQDYQKVHEFCRVKLFYSLYVLSIFDLSNMYCI